jgi:hypothetical protein
MVKLRWALALSALTIAAGLKANVMAAATFEEHDCSSTPQGAVSKLPLPLNKWGQITCTSLGQMLTSHDGWVWIMPDASGTVLIPSQDPEDAMDASTTESYFTKIDVVQVKGDEFNSAYGTFHIGFDEKEVKPDAYRVDLTSKSGRTFRMFFFDYDSYAWGMSCPDNKCDSETRFMILDKNHKPQPRQPAI